MRLEKYSLMNEPEVGALMKCARDLAIGTANLIKPNHDINEKLMLRSASRFLFLSKMRQ